MERLLVLFANGFPYHFSEPFLESEYPLYKEYFDKVLIITGCKRGEKPTHTVTDPTIEIVQDHTQNRDLLSLIEALPLVLTDKMFYRELKNLACVEGFTLRRLCSLLISTFSANHRALQAKRWLKKHPEYQVDTLYSYWMQVNAYAAVRLKQMMKKPYHTISRVHRFDLYSEFSNTGYLPFHRQLYKELDEIASISEDGKTYLENKYGVSNKISIYRLGALDREKHNPVAERKPFKIITCSRTAPIKRLDRVVDALSLITDRPIHWTHLGGGSCQEELEKYAAEKLPGNVTTTFSGQIVNTRVYEIYEEEPFHVFVNVSENEGVPVSIMEAMSFDIPAIATAVGGTAELMEHGKNGYLLPADYKDEELVGYICSLMDMPEETYLSFRAAARSKFERDYHATPNYRKFLEHLRNCKAE